MTEYASIHFFDQSIEVIFDKPPAMEKSPPCPDGFIWDGEQYSVTELLSEWSDFTRRGKYARNMRPAHAAVASNRGSLNVGRFYFRVKAVSSSSTIASPLGTAGKPEGRATTEPTKGQIFDMYYDRAMKSVDERKGQWFLYRELEET
jgi:hypothetical protein